MILSLQQSINFHVYFLLIMKRKSKQWWSSIPPILTKRTITFTSHLSWTHRTQGQTTTYDVLNPDLGLRQEHDTLTYTFKLTVSEALHKREMISMFSLWTFHLYGATFQQHLHISMCLSVEMMFKSLLFLSRTTEPRFLVTKLQLFCCRRSLVDHCEISVWQITTDRYVPFIAS